MAGIHEPDSVDLVALEATGEVVVVMVEDRPWGTDPDQASQLLTKANNYATYVLGGQLVRDFSQVEGKMVHIRLVCVNEPDDIISQVVGHIVDSLAPLGLTFEVRTR